MHEIVKNKGVWEAALRLGDYKLVMGQYTQYGGPPQLFNVIEVKMAFDEGWG